MSRARSSPGLQRKLPDASPIPSHVSRESLVPTRDPCLGRAHGPIYRIGVPRALDRRHAHRRAARRVAAPQGVPLVRHSLTSTIIVPIFREDPGLWEDLVHYRPRHLFLPDARILPDFPIPAAPRRALRPPGTTATRPPPASRPPHREYPRPTDRITYRGDQMAAAVSMTSRQTDPALADMPCSPTGLGCRVRGSGCIATLATSVVVTSSVLAVGVRQPADRP
jgi:hypothetical protein